MTVAKYHVKTHVQAHVHRHVLVLVLVHALEVPWVRAVIMAALQVAHPHVGVVVALVA